MPTPEQNLESNPLEADTPLNRQRVETQMEADSVAAESAGGAKTMVEVPDAGEASEAELQPGSKVGKYEIRAQLGQGGMGAVYLAYDPLIEREVALKVLAPKLVHSATALQRFLGEARAIGKLNHPHVVSIYDIDQWNGQFYLVMELLSGGSVADLEEQSGALTWEEACRISAEAAQGLAAAHAVGLIHRDIKPENLMLAKDGAVKVVDFGLSKLVDSANDPHVAVTRAGQILGTPQYMSPEQFESAEVDARTDIYSLGATLFRLLTGRFPYHDCSTILQVMSAHLSKPPPVPSEFVATVPVECNRIVSRAMAKNPAERYQSAAELATDLQELLQQPARGSLLIEDDVDETADRPLATAIIVEPSRLQAAVLKDALTRAGARAVQIAGTAESAQQLIEQGAPDLLVTAMQLPDGLGLDLLRELCRKSLLQQTTVVLNSSDSTVLELANAAQAACLILAPKKVRPEEILRAAHAAGPCIVPSGPLAAPLDATQLRLQIVLESGRIPESLATMIRDLALLDVEVTSNSTCSSPPSLRLIVRGENSTADAAHWADIATGNSESAALTAAVQSDGDQLRLRAACRNGVVSVCNRPLDRARLSGLLQSCRL